MKKEVQRTIVVKHHRWLARVCMGISLQMGKTGIEANVRVIKNDREYKLGPTSKLSPLKLMSMSAREGDELEVFAEGPDAEEALEAFEAVAHMCASKEVEMLRRRERRRSARLRGSVNRRVAYVSSNAEEAVESL